MTNEFSIHIKIKDKNVPFAKKEAIAMCLIKQARTAMVSNEISDYKITLGPYEEYDDNTKI